MSNPVTLADIFLALTEAVFGYALDKIDPAKRVYGWLKRDPAKLAFQKALADAYADFARGHPTWVAEQFDASFLNVEAAPELARLLTRNGKPSPQKLAALWAKSLPGKVAEAHVETASQAASAFIALFTDRLKTEPVFEALFNARAFESIEANIEALTAELRRALEAATQARQTAISIQGNVSGSVVVGDYNTFTTYNFTGPFATLQDWYDPPDDVYDRVGIDDFVGREWLEEKVLAFINDPRWSSGAWILEGGAGLGKTSFMAHLVKQWNCLHLFGERFPGQEKLEPALKSLTAQIVARYQLEDYARRDVVPDLPAGYENFLVRLLRAAAGKLKAGEKIIIVCDALDEAGLSPNGAPFGLPRNPPQGVYFLLSMRPVTVTLRFEVKTETLAFEDYERLNQQDIEKFLANVAARPKVAKLLSNKGYGPREFVETLRDKSAGVWMYLHYVIQEIMRDERTPLDLSALPVGLVGYYSEYWDDWRKGRRGRGEGWEAWNGTYAPLLTTLAVARESLSLEQLRAWAEVKADRYRAQNVLNQWRAFVTARDEPTRGKDKFYLLYHASLRDFLTGEAGRGFVSSITEFLGELRQRATEAHQRIVDFYQAKCSGDWPKLVADAVDDEYARVHLCAHLEGAEQFPELFKLVAKGDAWAKAREAHEGTYVGFLNDLTLAWRWAEGEADWDAARQVRCALIESSLRSRAAKIPPKLLQQLVQTKLWSGIRALTLIYQLADEDQKVSALLALAPELSRTELVNEALTAALGIQDESAKASALSGLAEHLSGEQKAQVVGQALAAALGIQDESAKATALSELAEHLSGEQKAQVVGQALAVALGIQDESAKASALSGLAEHLSGEQKAQVVGQALAAALGIQDAYAKAIALSELAEHLSREQKAQVVEQALEVALEIANKFAEARVLNGLAAHLSEEQMGQALEAALRMANEHAKATALSELAEHLSGEQKAQVVGQALAAALRIADEFAKARALNVLAAHLSGEQKAQVVGQALAAALGIRDESAKARALSELAEHLSGKQMGQALAAALGIANEHVKASALSGLAEHLSGEQKAQVVGQALAAALRIADESAKARALNVLAEHLSGEQKAQVVGQALAAALGIRDESAKARALSELAEHLSGKQMGQALAVALGIQDESYKAIALNVLAAHLSGKQKAQVVGQALAAALRIADESAKARALNVLAEHLSGEQKAQVVGQALAAALGIQDAYAKATALSELAEHLSGEQKAQVVGQALAAALGIANEHVKASALSGLAEHLSGEQKAQVVGQALAAALGIADEFAEARALNVLAAHLSGEQIGQALAAALRMANEHAKATALSGLAERLSGEQKVQVVGQALEAALRIVDEYAKAMALGQMVAHLSGEQIGQALAAALRMANEHAKATALSGLAERLSGEQKAQVVGQALEAALRIVDEYAKAMALSGLAARLSGEEKEQVVRRAFLISHHARISASLKNHVLNELIAGWRTLNFKGLGRGSQLWCDVLHHHARKPRDELLRDLAAMAPLILHLGGQRAMDEAFEAMLEVMEWWP